MADTFTQLFEARADDDGTAILSDDRTWTWREYIAEARSWAAALLGAADTTRPVHIGTLLGNTPDMLIALAAGALGGYVTVGINTTRRGAALAADIARADCQIIITDADHRGLLDGLELSGVRVLQTGTPEWDQLVSTAGELEPLTVPTAMDTYMLIFTSGTSGNPKPVQLPHMLPPFSGGMLADKYQIGSDDVCYVSMPLFHSAALVAGFAVGVAGGAAIVPARFSATTFLSDIRHFGATYMNYVGKPLAYVLATPEQPDDADNPLRVAFGNEATDRDIDEFGRRFGCTVWDGFGSTELAIIITREPGTPPGSIGRGYPGVAIYDSSTVTECAVAEFDENGALTNADAAVGEIVNTSGAGLFQGYYNDETATNERLRDGMYWSGDLGYRDADGWIYLAGRTGDWMRVDGENMAAGPIERILLRLPEINRVAVYPVPDKHVGDAVMAAVVLQDDAELTPEAFAEQLAAQPDLSSKAWPTHVRIASDLPTTATNKILKRELRSQGAAAGGDLLWTRDPRTTVYHVAAAATSSV